MNLRHAVAAEFTGTALLLAAVVGSGIMGERLAGGNAAVALLANALATGAALVALIAAFGPASGAHFNPLVSLTELALRRRSGRATGWYLAAQVAGGISGVLATHYMFELPLFAASTHARTGPHQWWSEVVASFGLLTVILNVGRTQPQAIPVVVGLYITSAYWFTASTSFANPAVTIARAFTDTFSGIRLGDAPGFIASQAVGAFLAYLLFRWCEPSLGLAPQATHQTADPESRHF